MVMPFAVIHNIVFVIHENRCYMGTGLYITIVVGLHGGVVGVPLKLPVTSHDASTSQEAGALDFSQHQTFLSSYYSIIHGPMIDIKNPGHQHFVLELISKCSRLRRLGGQDFGTVLNLFKAQCTSVQSKDQTQIKDVHRAPPYARWMECMHIDQGALQGLLCPHALDS